MISRARSGQDPTIRARLRLPREARLEVPLLRPLAVTVVLALAAVCAPSTAHAQQQVCSEPLTHERWRERMDEIDAAFSAFQPDQARQLLAGLREDVLCLDSIARPSHLGRFARQMALAAFFQQDEVNALRWGLLQRYAAPTLPWPADIGEGHPLRSMLTDADEPVLAGPDDAGVAHPKKGAVFMNGRVLEAPRARAEVPNLVQVADKKGVVLLTMWQDGAAFSEDVLGEPGTVAVTPRWFVPEDEGAVAGAASSLFEPGDAVADGPAPVTDAKGRPVPPDLVGTPLPVDPPPPHRSSPAPTARILAGVGLAAVGGSLYGLGYLSRGGLEAATTEEELIRARSRVNLLVVGGGAMALAGMGVGVTAFVAQDGGGLGWIGRF